MLTTNYKPIPISQPPEMKGKYFALEVNHGQPEWRQLWYEPYNDSWHEDGDQFHPTHWLMPVPDSIILTREELEAVWNAAEKWSAAPMKAEREQILRGHRRPPHDYTEILDKEAYINNLLNPTQ